ncbi:hypothetical protein HPB47_015471 [Ixodes persulcatus]|uniref:Uncharacterized protein n=1 Tax=Ixodes persulcatus TaxID=34615 RepID=A0AC60QTE4_IXOPE|nr:hypothetical protein HPB47_015471 [Ixodes persulcatus]
MIDESTDISSCRHLCVVTRVFEGDRILDAFFDIVPVEDASAGGLYKALIGAFEKAGVPYKDNMVGFAADIEDLLKEVYNYFNVSPKRADMFKSSRASSI